VSAGGAGAGPHGETLRACGLGHFYTGGELVEIARRGGLLDVAVRGDNSGQLFTGHT